MNDNLPVEQQEQLPTVQTDNERALSKEAQEDYELSRNTYRDLISQSNDALEAMVELAQESEHPRAFEVLSNMVRTIADVTDKLMDLQKSKQEVVAAEHGKVKQNTPSDSEGGTTNNTIVFAGTTEELQRRLAAAAEQSSLKDITPTEVKE